MEELKNETEKQESISVRNKDIPILAEIFCLMQDIRNLEQRREWQKDRMLNITQHLSSTPGGGGGSPKGLEEAFSMISEIENEHEEKIKSYTRQIKRAQKIINNIESRSMRTFVTMKYVMNVPDTDIRKELNISRREFERAKKCVESAESMSMVKWQERYIIEKKGE